jgi:hypothetical protein
MKKAHHTSIGLVLLCLAPVPGAGADEAMEEQFSGFYLGASVASQNVWAGSSINGIDFRAQDRRPGVDAAFGWRWQFDLVWVVGIEVQYGWLTGDLGLGVGGDPLHITYANDHQWGIGGHAGRTVGDGRHLVYLYAYETDRDFDVKVTGSFGSFSQRDEQGFLRFGLGLETAWSARLHSSILLGSYRVDFGGVPSNLDVSGEFDLRLGLVYHY